MWKPLVPSRQIARHLTSIRWTSTSSKPIVHIANATFYRNYPSSSDTPESNPPLFSHLDYTLPSHTILPECWAIVSPSSKARTTFLQILAGQHICIPPTARHFPYLSDISQSPQHAIKYVGFDADRGNAVGGTSVRGAYLSARYESRREETDFSVSDYLLGQTELNAMENKPSEQQLAVFDQAVKQLNLKNLLAMPVANLSNGQTRRARIAKALMARPEVLLLDGPFMGLDPSTLVTMSRVLGELASRQQPRLVLSLRPEDVVPEWVTHLVVVNHGLELVAQGEKGELSGRGEARAVLDSVKHVHETVGVSRDGFPRSTPELPVGEAVVQFDGVKVTYGDGESKRTVLGDWKQTTEGEETSGLHWTLHRGQRCGIFGANGSGKTTMLSLITSDHPQTYSLPIKLFGKSRLPGPGEPGISVFELQKRMGHSSPEVHAFFPKHLSIRRALQSAFADAPLVKPKLDEAARRKVNACLRWFARELAPSQTGQTALEKLEVATEGDAPAMWAEMEQTESDLEWADRTPFRELSFSNQRLVLFLRARVASPELVILDEALSGIDETIRDKALLFLSQGEKVSMVHEGRAIESTTHRLGHVVHHGLSPDQALLVISHSKEDVPGCLREWICLPEPGEGKAPRTGKLSGPLELNPRGWGEIWGRC